MSDKMDPKRAIDFFRDTDNRTYLWGVENQTNESIKIAFGQLTSIFDLPEYANDTGVKTVCSNTGNGASCLRDPLIDTGGAPIAATYFNFSIEIGGQVLNGIDKADPGYYMPEAVFIVYYEERSSFGEERNVKLEVVSRKARHSRSN